MQQTNSNKDRIISKNQLDDETRLKVLKAHKNKIFKTFNNYILYDVNLTENQKNILISHCKKIIEMDLVTISDIDVAFTPEFKKYARRNWDDVPETVRYNLRLFLMIFIAEMEKEKEISKIESQ